MPFVARYVILMNDGFVGPLDWNADVVGGNVAALNVEIGVANSMVGFPGETPPPGVQVAVTFRVPNGDAGVPSISQQLIWDIPLIDATPVLTAAGEVFRYQRAIPWSDLVQTASVGPAPTLTYATLARVGGTSDQWFSSGVLGVPLNPLIAPRGRAVQPSTLGVRTGDKPSQRPDAFSLLQSGGQEVVDSTFIPSLSVQLDPLVALPSDFAMFQSAANVFYYSGHGLSADNCLAIEVSGGGPTHPCWARPADFVSLWRTQPHLKFLIIAGCSVLGIDTNVAPPTGPGLVWADLLVKQGGFMEAMLGYGAFAHTAPLDQSGGNEIGESIGKRFAAGSVDYVSDWLSINAEKSAWNACAWDGTGRFWWIDTPHLPLLWSLKSLQVF
jgi:hypothetical protein